MKKESKFLPVFGRIRGSEVLLRKHRLGINIVPDLSPQKYVSCSVKFSRGTSFGGVNTNCPVITRAKRPAYVRVALLVLTKYLAGLDICIR